MNVSRWWARFVALIALVGVIALGSVAHAAPVLEIYSRPGCPHCADAKAWAAGLRERHPTVQVVVRDVVADAQALRDLEALVEKRGIGIVGVPTFRVGGEVWVGFDGPDSTGRRIEAAIERALAREAATRPGSSAPGGDAGAPGGASAPVGDAGPPGGASAPVGDAGAPGGASAPVGDAGPPGTSRADGGDAPRAPPVPSGSAEPASPLDDGAEPGPSAAPAEDVEIVDVPLLGQLDARRLGLPLFTIALGLVDGFNPCAMWVLLFLLAMLVNLRDRKRIALIAGTFVLVSGLAYYAFMAAWLNAFLLVGLSRAAQVVLGIFAVIVGSVHVKDFFAFGKGVSFSIPESAKPGIYARTRKIVAAKSLWLAVAGAFALAVVVNVIELLCTAGLPALYAQVLVHHQLSPAERYAYLALYDLAYMLDDGIMVTIAIVTLGKRKLQERGGRWLKLLSGATILVLGVLLLVAPELLVW